MNDTLDIRDNLPAADAVRQGDAAAADGGATTPAVAVAPPFVRLERAKLIPLQPRDAADAEALPATLHALQMQAADDQHIVVCPTHIMVKGHEILGYLSLGGLPVVHAWFDSHHKHALDSLKMIETGEAIFADKGVRQFAVACAEHSPFTPHMERLGFTKLGTTVLWTKKL